MAKFVLNLSEIDIEVETRFESVKDFAKNYLSDSASPLFAVSVDENEVKTELSVNSEECSEDYAESICIYRAIAEQLPYYDRFVFHGAAITYGDRAYIFTAPSGTGKSTHIGLWREHIGKDVDIINGDKPIIRATADGVTVFSSPWSGKEHWNKNRSAPLAGICIIKRGKENRIRKISGGSAIANLIKQMYLPKSREAKLLTLTLLDRILATTPIYILECDMSKDAVRTSFEALTGEEMK